jgi:hypothetical protein
MPFSAAPDSTRFQYQKECAMKKLLHTSSIPAFALAATTATAHPGHGLGAVGHDVQHQLWIFGALVVAGAVCMLVQNWNKPNA